MWPHLCPYGLALFTSTYFAFYRPLLCPMWPLLCPYGLISTLFYLRVSSNPLVMSDRTDTNNTLTTNVKEPQAKFTRIVT